MGSKLKYFSLLEWLLWSGSSTVIIAFFLIFDRSNYLNLIASLLGAAALILLAKGNPIGQILIIIFGIIYGIISFSCAYYGEMITYVGMTVPMAVIAFISWIMNPYNGNRSEVKIRVFKMRDLFPMVLISAAVTVAFWFILKHFNTANLIPSTISVATSFVAVYLTFLRSPYYALAYAANDIVLLVLWSLATAKDISYISVLICFAVFLVNDIYGFICWKKNHKRQMKNA